MIRRDICEIVFPMDFFLSLIFGMYAEPYQDALGTIWGAENKLDWQWYIAYTISLNPV